MPGIIRTLAIPLASTDRHGSKRFRPGKLAPKLWPRPILFIHGIRDDIIDFANAQALYDHATEPKYYLWLPSGSHNDIIESDAAAKVWCGSLSAQNASR